MKKRWLLLLVGLFLAHFVSGQSPLNERVSVDFKDLPLTDALYNLIDQGVRLTFNNNIIPKDKQVTLQVLDERVGRVLQEILDASGLGVEVVGSQIVIVAVKVAAPLRMFTLSGFVTDSETGERVINAAIFDEKRKTGTYTNEFGYFSLTMTEGPSNLLVTSLGYENDTLRLSLNSNQKLEISLSPYVLAEVVVAYFNDSSFLSTDFGALELNLEQAGRLPSLGGETDVIRLAYSMPGIQTGADGFGGMSVRGGDIDQNLFLLDGVPVYNATHGLGIYSIYNTAAVRNARILKGNFPAQYGGRISSIWDIQTKEGNLNKLQGEVELGLSSLQLTMEGPLAKGKGSWFVSGRRSLFDFLSVPISRRLRDKENSSGYLKYFFYDLNGKVNFKITPKDRVYLSVYRGKDDFVDKLEQGRWFQDTFSIVSNEELVNWGNNVIAMRWNHLISDKIFANVTATYSNYFYDSEDLVDLDLLSNDKRLFRDVLFQKYKSSVEDIGLKTDFDYTTYRNHRFRFGTSFTQHKFQPGVISFEELTIFNSETRDTIGAYLKTPLISNEFDVYVQDELKIGNDITANIGIRGSALTVEGSVFYALQPRLLLTLFNSRRTSYNFSSTRNTQFLHLLSPTNIGLPKDLWVSATKDAPPQEAWQFTVGIRHKAYSWLTIELEGYYKYLSNIIYYKGGTLEAINSSNWQDEIAEGRGWAYGAELLMRVERGKMGGWLAYTYGHADRQFGNDVNNGDKYPLRLDRRHNFNIQYLYKINKKWDFSASFMYATGSAFTFPSQQFEVEQPTGSAPTEIKTINVITRLNPYRLPDYHRLDFTFNRNFAVRNVNHTLKLGVYNAYFRRNPVYYTLRDNFDENDQLQRQVVQVSLLPFFPTLRYIMEFK